MLNRLLSLPLIVILMGLGAVAMYVPAAHALAVRDFEVMRAFFESANLILILTAMIAIATANRVVRNQGRAYLLALIAAFAGLPVLLAVPFAIAVPDTSFLNAYLEMVSDLTTTGATLFSEPGRLPPSVHLWRALVGWLGGLLLLVAAAAVLAPMNLGGFEVVSSAGAGRGVSLADQGAWMLDGPQRLRRFTARIAPIYLGLTVALWAVLLGLGDTPLVALSHAMAVLSTSGISPVGGLSGSVSGQAGEAAIFVMLIFAISRQAMALERGRPAILNLGRDPEFRIGLFFVLLVPSLLFLRHWIGALEVSGTQGFQAGARQGFQALWGGVFTVMSFLTTTGFESAAWGEARHWSGLPTPGIILMGLALTGGGVATTAGGIKLLRVYALYKHGARELERLVHPSSVGGAGSVARRLRRQGAQAAWVFFMLFCIGIAIAVMLFAMNGVGFDDAVALTVAALSNTGPVLSVAVESPIDLQSLSGFSKAVLAAAMVLGRLETLALVGLMNPGFWRG